MFFKMDSFCKYTETYSPKQIELISQEFRRLTGQYYLEHAGATLYSERQLEEIVRQLSKNVYANPHSRNLSSKLTEDAVDIIRYQILKHFKTDSEEYSVIFTSSATAALKLIAASFQYEDGNFVYLQDNHTSVLGMRAYAPSVSCLTVNDAFDHLLGDTPCIHEKTCLKYPLSWIDTVKRGGLNNLVQSNCQNWFVALDAASYCSTSELNLSLIKPDFVTISFYKIFGYPTGLGALLVRNSSGHTLKKTYYGGGTVFMAQTLENTVIFRDLLHERFEDGTLPFTSILELKQGFDTIKRLSLTFDNISQHTFSLAQYVYRNLVSLHHSNGRPVVVLYHDTTFQSSTEQGGIVNFNLLRDNGEYVGYSEVLHFSNLYNIHLRTGCFCNPGACQYFLKLSPEDVKRHFEAGHVCGDQNDLVDGFPTGSVRVSFGYMSTKADADKLLEMIENCFVTNPAIRKLPTQYDQLKSSNKKSVLNNTQQSNDNGILQQIILYPIKSCGGFPVFKWPLTSTGLKYDRQWMIVNCSGVCITQKHNKKLCLVQPTIDLDKNNLTLSYPGHKPIQILIDLENDELKQTSLCQSKVCGDKIQGWDCGDQVADWLTEVLDNPGLRLLRQCSENENFASRSSRNNQEMRLSLVNKAQYLLINSSSVEWLRDQISDDQFTETIETTIQRFRPNFVVKFSKAFVENDCKEFKFDNVKFKTGGVCTRCQMICIDQTTAKASKEPLQTLAKVFKGKISFGIYLNRTESLGYNCLSVGCNVLCEN